MRQLVLLTKCFLFSFQLFAQNLSNLSWLNAPESYSVEEGSLVMDVTPKSDFWRKTHYGFIVDDGPFYYETRSGEFEASVKISGEYKTRFDQMGLMLRIDEKNWIKTGIEFVDGVFNFSTVITNDYSSWSVVALKEKPKFVWIKAVRKLDAVEIFYSFDGKSYQLSNVAYFPEQKPAMVGMMAASPDGNGFKARFDDFKVKHLPDSRRLKWLEENK